MTAKICFTMDNLSDAADLGRGLIDKPRLPGQRPALEQGFPAMLDLYDKYGVKVTHFLEGWNGEAHPDIVEDLINMGHSVGMHGWQHEAWSELSLDQETELMGRSTDALHQASGVRPTAFRAPGGRRTANTVKLLSEFGYTIDSSMNAQNEDGGEIQALTNTLWHVPYLEATIDARQWLQKNIPAKEVELSWHNLLEGAREKDGFLVFIWHPHVMGVTTEYREVGESVLQKVTQDKGFQIVTLEELVYAKIAEQ